MEQIVRNFKSKSSQIFTLDLIGTIIILTISIGIFLSYSSSYQKGTNFYEEAPNIMDILTANEIDKFNNDIIVCYFKEKKIEDRESSAIKQAIKFYKSNPQEKGFTRDCNQNATKPIYEQLIEVITSSHIPEKANFRVLLNRNEVLYEKLSLSEVGVENASRITQVSRTLVFANKSLEFYNLEVLLWQ